IPGRANRHLDKGRVVIFAAGTGNPFFTTDTAAALRAAEINAEKLCMAKFGTDGVYDKDPREHIDAVKFPRMTHQQYLNQNLGVLDMTAVAHCQQTKTPIIVFDMDEPGSVTSVLTGQGEAEYTEIVPGLV
ncbi:MAG: UMP kinase, partial [Actinomycetota bacterium]